MVLESSTGILCSLYTHQTLLVLMFSALSTSRGLDEPKKAYQSSLSASVVLLEPDSLVFHQYSRRHSSCCFQNSTLSLMEA